MVILINLNDARKKLNELEGSAEYNKGVTDAFNALFDLPTIEAEPTKHGRWEQVEVVHDRKDAKIQDWQQAKCSVCGKWNTTPYMYYLKLDDYCPNCGAKMDLIGEDKSHPFAESVMMGERKEDKDG